MGLLALGVGGCEDVGEEEMIMGSVVWGVLVTRRRLGPERGEGASGGKWSETGR